MAKLEKKQDAVSVMLIKGFVFLKGWALLTLDNDGKNLRVIIGEQQFFSVADLLPLKGHEIEVSYQGEKETASGKFDRVFIECIM